MFNDTHKLRLAALASTGRWCGPWAHLDSAPPWSAGLRHGVIARTRATNAGLEAGAPPGVRSRWEQCQDAPATLRARAGVL